jgi:ATP synthase protein I
MVLAEFIPGKIGMKEKEKLPDLEALEARIEQARPKEPEGPEGKAPDPMRIGIELMSGVFVGGFLGFYLDKWLGTKPFLLIILLLLGAAAGFRNIYRMVGPSAEPAPDNTKDKK